MAFFTEGISVLQTLVTAIGAGLGAWGVITLWRAMGMITLEQSHKESSN
jgi:hypothetical protein